jgi:hypothetical protein
VRDELPLQVGQLARRWQLAVEQQAGHLGEGAFLGELAHWVASVKERTPNAIDESNAAPANDGVRETWIVRGQPSVVRVEFQLAKTSGMNGAVGNRQYLGTLRSLVRDGNGLIHGHFS